MTDTSDDDERKREERQRGLDEVRRIKAEMTMAHTMSDQESEEAMVDMHLEDKQKRHEQLRAEDPIGYAAFGDDDEWVEKRLGD